MKLIADSVLFRDGKRVEPGASFTATGEEAKALVAGGFAHEQGEDAPAAPAATAEAQEVETTPGPATNVAPQPDGTVAKAPAPERKRS